MEDNLWQRQERLKITNSVWVQIDAIYQSKRAQLKKQVTHWYGKFMIVKAENNRLRAKIRTMDAVIAVYKLTQRSGNVTVVGEGAPGRKDCAEIISTTKEPVKC